MSRKIICIAITALAATVIPQLAHAVCNLGEDAKNLTEFRFGQAKLYGFPVGTLKVSGQHAMPNFDSWPFSLYPSNKKIEISVASSSGRNFSGTLKLTRPITGYILERLVSGSCSRELRVTDNALAGAAIHFNSGILENDFGGTIQLAGLNFVVRSQENFSDSRLRTRGLLTMSGKDIKILGAKVRLPARDKSPTSVDLNAEPGKQITLQLSLVGLAARIKLGAFNSDPITMEIGSFPADWSKSFLWSERAQTANVADLKLATLPQGGSRISFNISGAQEKAGITFIDTSYEREAKRDPLREGLTATFAAENKEAARKLVGEFGQQLGISADQATQFIQLKRDVIDAATRHRKGEEEDGFMASPAGYTFCRAEMLEYKTEFQRKDHDTTMNVRVLRARDNDGLAYYTVVPESTAGTSIKMKMRLIFAWVDPDNPEKVTKLLQDGKCQEHNMCPWTCKSNDCERDVKNCVPSERRPDRILAAE